MKDYLKKSKQMLYLSKSKKIVILIVTCCLVLGGISPTINSIIIKNEDLKNNDQIYEDDDDKTNSDYKKTNYENQVFARASFNWDPRYPDPGEKVTFYSTSYAYNGFISSEKWEFYDGSTDIGHSTSHTFEKKDSYRVTLRVTAYGIHGGIDWDTSNRYVEVGADPFPEITCTPENPLPGERVTLDASKSNDPDGRITSYNWSFYNIEEPEKVTELGTNEIIYYTWEKQGIYIVSLFIEDDKGNNNTLEKAVHVSILKLDGFPTRSRGLSFEISNHGNITANNLEWNVEINRYSLLGIRSQRLYHKSGTISTLEPNRSQKVEIRDIRRAFCKIKLVVTAKADNAVEVSKSFYGVVFLKLIYLSEENFANPYTTLIFTGLMIALLLFIISLVRNSR